MTKEKDSSAHTAGKYAIIGVILTGLIGFAAIYYEHYLRKGEREELVYPMQRDILKKNLLSEDTATNRPFNSPKEMPKIKARSNQGEPNLSKPTPQTEPLSEKSRPSEIQKTSPTTSQCRFYVYSEERAKVQYFISGSKNAPPASELLEHGTEILIVDSRSQMGGVIMLEFKYGSKQGWIPESKTKKRCP